MMRGFFKTGCAWKRGLRPSFLLLMLLLFTEPLPFALADHGGPHEGTLPSQRLKRFLNKGDAAPDFVLLDQDREEVALSDFRGRALFLSFIHAGCKKRCPQILQSRKLLEASLQGLLGERPVFLAVTVDPQNDTPKVLSRYLRDKHFEPDRLHLLTGTSLSVRQVLSHYKINVVRDPQDGHVLWHTALGYAIGPEGRIKEVFFFKH